MIDVVGEDVQPPEGYGWFFPTRWLWEDFEEEMNQTIQSAIENKQSKKEKLAIQRRDRKNRLERLQESIKLKLTEEELKVIRFIK